MTTPALEGHARRFIPVDVVVTVAIIGVVVMMVIPLPTVLLDLLLAFNLTLSVTVLMVAMYTREPLQFSVFPSLLLVTTLFRLSLNVSSVRLILLNGYAGELIRRFGEFVVGGNVVVGLVVFFILVVIQFVVITKGAERVAEVAARFTLDAMPGKQMAIDADLNSGLIDETQARTRRRDIEREADFYGAMDGASKFVKGDAVAAVLITVISLVGGFIVGMLQKGLSAADAARQFSLLTVGDGLVTQIPALLISTATGIIVTRAASESDLGHDLATQLTAYPKVLALVAGLLVLFAMVPGLPPFPFLALACAAAYGARSVRRGAEEKARREAELQRVAKTEAVRRPENVVQLLPVDPIEIELGYALLPLAERNHTGDLAERVSAIRHQLALELGLVVPPVRIVDNIQLRPNQYVIRMRGVTMVDGELYEDRYLAMNPGQVAEEIDGLATREPAFGLPALWIPEEDRDRAELAGYTVVDPGSVLATHLTEVIRTNAPDLLSRQETQNLMNTVKDRSPVLLEELVPNLLTTGEVQRVLQNLLRENVSIRDLNTILETLADYARITRDVEVLTEYARRSLGRAICQQVGFRPGQGPLPVLTVDPNLEDQLVKAVRRTDTGSFLAVAPQLVGAVLESVRREASHLTSRGHLPIVVCSPEVRSHFRRLVEKAAGKLIVLSFAELPSNMELQAVGSITAGPGALAGSAS
jgi:flagellar biosynthesis protein FlhA